MKNASITSPLLKLPFPNSNRALISMKSQNKNHYKHFVLSFSFLGEYNFIRFPGNSPQKWIPSPCRTQNQFPHNSVALQSLMRGAKLTLGQYRSMANLHIFGHLVNQSNNNQVIASSPPKHVCTSPDVKLCLCDLWGKLCVKSSPKLRFGLTAWTLHKGHHILHSATKRLPNEFLIITLRDKLLM